MIKIANLAARGVLAIAIAGACAFAASGCSNSDSVAATVNGEEIPESVVTQYVETFMKTNNFDTDQWAQYLGMQDTTAAAFREDALDYYIDYLLYQQEAEKLGIHISDDDVDGAISKTKEGVGLSDEQWLEYLSTYGYTEETYRETVSYSLMVTAIQEQELGSDVEITEDQRKSFADQYILNYDGKHVYGIVFGKDSYDKAEALLKEILEAKDPAKAFMDNVDASENETLKNAKGDLGWSFYSTYGDNWSEVVTDLEEGVVYEYLYQADDNYYLLYCDDGYAPAYYGDVEVALKKMPKSVKSLFDADVKVWVYTQMGQEYVKGLREKADVVINDMPSGLPYDVEPVKTEDTSSSDSSADSGSK